VKTTNLLTTLILTIALSACGGASPPAPVAATTPLVPVITTPAPIVVTAPGITPTEKDALLITRTALELIFISGEAVSQHAQLLALHNYSMASAPSYTQMSFANRGLQPVDRNCSWSAYDTDNSKTLSVGDYVQSSVTEKCSLLKRGWITPKQFTPFGAEIRSITGNPEAGGNFSLKLYSAAQTAAPDFIQSPYNFGPEVPAGGSTSLQYSFASQLTYIGDFGLTAGIPTLNIEGAKDRYGNDAMGGVSYSEITKNFTFNFSGTYFKTAYKISATPSPDATIVNAAGDMVSGIATEASGKHYFFETSPVAVRTIEPMIQKAAQRAQSRYSSGKVQIDGGNYRMLISIQSEGSVINTEVFKKDGAGVFNRVLSRLASHEEVGFLIMPR
jgi:hypothetical protein